MVVDQLGNIFIADTGNNRIRKVDTNGIITTVAGNGIEGDGGDGGLAIEAELETPYEVAVDEVGNIFIVNVIGYYNDRSQGGYKWYHHHSSRWRQLYR
ncbi:hypothetical protein GKODMF_06900 [Candidatus Electrothrix gigas]